MANLSIREAVKFYRVSRPTLSKALKNGTISGVKDGKGKWKIDRAELDRVYQTRTIESGHGGQILRDNLSTVNTPEDHLETTALKREIDLLRDMLAKAETNTEHWRSMAERQQTLLEDKRSKGFFKRIFQ